MTEVSVVSIERLELAFAPRRWPFADSRRDEIAAYFDRLSRDNAALFNGAVLIMHQHLVADSVLQGQYLQTNYASFLAWRDWGFPDTSVRNCFALGAVRGSDGGFLLGVMGGHTSNPGRIYFPGGTPDPSDIVDGCVDLEGSMSRELKEETGLAAEEYSVEPGWTLVVDEARLALIKLIQADVPAALLRERALRHLAREARPELADIQIVSRAEDVTPLIPRFATAFLRHFWGCEQAAGRS
jgi:8-oxo-dGTP pyrophosphatase MutT (NUDIX family)